MNIKPEQIPDDVVEAAAKALHLYGANSINTDTEWDELFDGERLEYCYWAKAALAAALPVLLGEPVAFISKTELKGIPKHGGSSLTVLRTKQNGRLIALYTLPTQDTPNADQ